MMSGLIFKKTLRPVRSFAVTSPVHSNKFKIQNPPVVGSYKLAASALYDPFPRQSPKENKLKLWPKIYLL